MSRSRAFAGVFIGIVSCACSPDMNDRDGIAAERAQLRAQYGALFDEVSQILFELDPVGINFRNEHG